MTDQPTLMSQLLKKADLEIEGQVVPISLEIAQDDDLLRRALASIYPAYANAKFERQEDGDTLKVKVIKQYGTKG